jgi:hypothetical protein
MMMSEAKFTKGEWKILDKYQVGINVDFGDGFFTVASCQVFNEAKANAHLIAAAPEMYSELDELSGIIRRMGVDSASDRIDLLLAKARGEK